MCEQLNLMLHKKDNPLVLKRKKNPPSIKSDLKKLIIIIIIIKRDKLFGKQLN